MSLDTEFYGDQDLHDNSMLKVNLIKVNDNFPHRCKSKNFLSQDNKLLKQGI